MLLHVPKSIAGTFDGPAEQIGSLHVHWASPAGGKCDPDYGTQGRSPLRWPRRNLPDCLHYHAHEVGVRFIPKYETVTGACASIQAGRRKGDRALNHYAGHAHPIRGSGSSTRNLVPCAANCLLDGNLRIIRRPSAFLNGYAGFPCVTPTPTGLVRSVRKPSQRLLGRSDAYPKAIIFKDYGLIPTCDEHNPVPSGALSIQTNSGQAVIVPSTITNEE
jgi:hypothetical protein